MTQKKQTETEGERLAREFKGMGSHAAHERELVRRHVRGTVSDEQMIGSAWSDLEAEAQRIAADAPRVQAHLEAARAEDAARAQRRLKLLAQQQPDRVDPFVGVTGPLSSWESIAASAHAEQRRAVVGDTGVSRYSDPGDDPLRPNEQLVDKYIPRGVR